VRILVERGCRIGLGEAIGQATELLDGQGIRASGTPGPAGDPLAFILDRLRYYGRTVHGLRDDVMEAVLRQPGHPVEVDPTDLLARMRALQAITTRPEFDPLIIGFKRAHRLVEKETWTGEAVDPARFQHPAEETLHRALRDAQESLPTLLREGRYREALEQLVRMKPAIDGFFTGVLVNAEDEALRSNRLSLLRATDRLFLAYADFSEIVVQGG
jgi:glycyl-tRNA synthetase beta chain